MGSLIHFWVGDGQNSPPLEISKAKGERPNFMEEPYQRPAVPRKRRKKQIPQISPPWPACPEAAGGPTEPPSAPAKTRSRARGFTGQRQVRTFQMVQTQQSDSSPSSNWPPFRRTHHLHKQTLSRGVCLRTRGRGIYDSWNMQGLPHEPQCRGRGRRRAKPLTRRGLQHKSPEFPFKTCSLVTWWVPTKLSMLKVSKRHKFRKPCERTHECCKRTNRSHEKYRYVLQ